MSIEQYLVRYKAHTGEHCQVGPISAIQLKKFLEIDAPNLLEVEVYRRLPDEELNQKLLDYKADDLFRLLSDMRKMGAKEGVITGMIVKRDET